jgi:hypothetical protein
MVDGRLAQGGGSGSAGWANIMTLVLGVVLDREGEGLPVCPIVGSADRSLPGSFIARDQPVGRYPATSDKGSPAANLAHLAFTARTSAMRVV